jgi:Domain of unknown function (DUF4388)
VSVHTPGKNQGPERNGAAAPPGARPAAVASRGFSAQLRGASLWDLVQMECLARSHLAVQVVGEGGVGYLYFDRGHIVHATTLALTGEAAAMEILGWTIGSFQTCDRPWPDQVTIKTSHEGLILQAAQLQDESGASNLVAFPTRGLPSASEESFEELELSEIAEEGDGEMRSTKMDEGGSVPGGGRAEMSGDFTVVMRLGPSGAVITNRGGSEELAETVAYTQRLLQLAGELLGFEEFSAAECAFVEGRCLMFSEGEGEVVALRPRPDANLQTLRERLGL